jgi:hypothetical protein
MMANGHDAEVVVRRSLHYRRRGEDISWILRRVSAMPVPTAALRAIAGLDGVRVFANRE